MFPKGLARQELLAAGTRRYALAPACLVLAVLLNLSPAGPLFPPAAPFVFAVLCSGWFGGVGPGFVTALLGALLLPQLTAVSYPLLGGFLDVPRFIAFSVIGLAVGWASARGARKLREQERYARAMEVSDDGFWDWIPASDTMYASPRLRQIYGFAPDENFAGRDDLIARIPFHPEDRPRLMHAFAEHFAGETARYGVEARHIRDGETRWVQLTGMAARDRSGRVVRWTGTARDVTERKRGEEALRESQQRYELAMAASGSGYFDWHIPTDEYFASPRALELAGFPPDTPSITRQEFLRGCEIHPEDFARWDAARTKVLTGTGDHASMELRYIVRGETRWHLIHGICRRDDTGKAVRWAGSMTDITARKLAEEELKAMDLKLRQAQRLEAMGTLAGGIAHDFNNILGAIIGYGEMAVRDAPKGSRLARDLANIMIAGERGRALIDRVLVFSRSAVSEVVPVHVEKVVREALDLLSAELPSSVTLQTTLHAGRAAVRGDPTQVHQVVVNLAMNGIQAMPAGGTLRVALANKCIEAPHTATIGSLETGEYVVLTVADTGTGIAPEIVEHIFNPFFTTKEVGAGTGLGLSLVHGIVTELDGAIDVSSTPGSSTTFIVYLPRSGDAAEHVHEIEAAPPRGEGQRVMIVDDEGSLVELATRVLADLGYAPTGFNSSAAALSAFRADPDRFDALLTDERMPGMSGSALIREVRGIRSDMPAVLMSGYMVTTGPSAQEGNQRDAPEAAEAPLAIVADEILRKPVSASDLAASLARVLRA